MSAPPAPDYPDAAPRLRYPIPSLVSFTPSAPEDDPPAYQAPHTDHSHVPPPQNHHPSGMTQSVSLSPSSAAARASPYVVLPPHLPPHYLHSSLLYPSPEPPPSLPCSCCCADCAYCMVDCANMRCCGEPTCCASPHCCPAGCARSCASPLCPAGCGPKTCPSTVAFLLLSATVATIVSIVLVICSLTFSILWQRDGLYVYSTTPLLWYPVTFHFYAYQADYKGIVDQSNVQGLSAFRSMRAFAILSPIVSALFIALLGVRLWSMRTESGRPLSRGVCVLSHVLSLAPVVCALIAVVCIQQLCEGVTLPSFWPGTINGSCSYGAGFTELIGAAVLSSLAVVLHVLAVVLHRCRMKRSGQDGESSSQPEQLLPHAADGDLSQSLVYQPAAYEPLVPGGAPLHPPYQPSMSAPAEKAAEPRR